MLKGISNFDFCIKGEIIKAEQIIDIIGKCKNKIVVLKYASPDCVLLFKDVLGIICEFGGRTCHLSVLSFEMNIPCVVGVENLCKLQSGTIVKINACNGEALINED